MIYYASNPVYFVGDLHGNFHWIKAFIEKYDLHDCSIIFCGDAGLGFRKLKDWYGWVQGLKLVKCLKSRRISLYFVRGNHDNPAWFDDKTLVTSCFKAVSDYSVITTPSHNILCVGGGISPDRYQRRLDNSLAITKYLKYHPNKTCKDALKEVQLGYWEDENPVFLPDKISSLTCQIDTICSHVAPTFLAPPSGVPKKWVANDRDLAEDCFLERLVLDKVYDRLVKLQHPVTSWYYGHYHRYGVSEYKGVTGHLLDMARDGNFCIKELM